MEQDGQPVGRISLMPEFVEGDDVYRAAALAIAAHEGTGSIDGRKKSVSGADDAERINYSFKAAAEPGSPLKDAAVRGVDVVGSGQDGQLFLVRINAMAYALSDAQLEKVIKSISVAE